MNGELSDAQLREYAGWGATLLRLVLGVIYIMHGWLALMVIGPEGMAGYVARLGYPAWLSLPFAWYLIVAHLVGGALLIVGYWTRIAALAQVPIMAAATLQFRWWQGFFLKSVVIDPTGRTLAGGYEYDLLVLGATCAMALLGPGKLALDNPRDELELP
jgi:putative oxidoreductase